MQHKFCLVDDQVLMTGTLNWGNDRSFDHWNYVYITNKKQLVEPVKKEFYQMWNIASDVLSVFDISGNDTETIDINNQDEESEETTDLDVLDIINSFEQQTSSMNNYISTLTTQHPCVEA